MIDMKRFIESLMSILFACLSLATAYATVDKSFKEYRNRVKEKFGDAVDKELKYNLKAKTFEKTETDEDGNEKTILENADISEYDGCSEYARFFDETSKQWYGDRYYAEQYVKGQQAYFNNLFKLNGHVYLNDVYDVFDMPRSKAGQVVGWIYDPDGNNDSDNEIVFEYHWVKRDKANSDDMNRYEYALLIDFNVDGYIWDKM